MRRLGSAIPAVGNRRRLRPPQLRTRPEVGSLSLVQALDRTFAPSVHLGLAAVRARTPEAAPDCSACQHGAQKFSFARRLRMFCHGKE
ncbi:MAG: hypothetical protein QOI10_4265 [Solirubrobacterales bacterium]|nr:hypothetical protein [Solirubrobacterales bacterium]